jgi:hypothetical protein
LDADDLVAHLVLDQCLEADDVLILGSEGLFALPLRQKIADLNQLNAQCLSWLMGV